MNYVDWLIIDDTGGGGGGGGGGRVMYQNIQFRNT